MERKSDLTPDRKLSVNTRELQELLGCGRHTACKIGKLAGARMQLGKRILWNVGKIKAYLDQEGEWNG